MSQPRPTTTARGYGGAHQRLRRQLLAYTREHPETAHCWRCARSLVDLDEHDIHLGHDDTAASSARRATTAPQAEATNAKRRGVAAAPPAPCAEHCELVVDLDDL